jgi:serine/threonine protein kinase
MDVVKKLERFVIKEAIGGGVGTVYRAEEQLPGNVVREVALKVLPVIGPGDQGAAQRFFSEVAILAQLAVHPNVVTIYSIGLTENTPWIAMEYCQKTLGQTIGDHPEPAGDVLKMIEQVACGLATMHALDPPLIHQDLKPANILVDRQGNFKITDFSLTSLVAAHKTQNVLTVRYAAPELLSREFGTVCPATDLYALGHIAYEMALGGRQYRMQFPTVYEGMSNKEAHPAKWMQWHCSITTLAPPIVEVRKDFPIALSDLIAKLMAKGFKERFTRAEEVVEALAQAKAEMNAAPVMPAAGQPLARAMMPQSTMPARPPMQAPAVVQAPPPPSLTDGPMVSQPTQAAPQENNLRYWVRFRGRTAGPYDVATLQKHARQGLISRLHQVSTDQVHWNPANTVEGLFGTPTA